MPAGKTSSKSNKSNKKSSKSSGRSWKLERASVTTRKGSRPRSNKYSRKGDTSKKPKPGERERAWVGGYTRAGGKKVEGHYRDLGNAGSSGGTRRSSRSSANGSKTSANRSQSTTTRTRTTSTRARSTGARARTASASRAGSSANVTMDHDLIRRWVEERGGRPACVRNTGDGGDIGMLRIDFPGHSGVESLELLPWEQFFEKFDKSDLAFLYQDETKAGAPSRFSNFVDRNEA